MLDRMAPSSRPATLLAGLLASSSVLHVLVPKPFEAMIPSALPGSARSWNRGAAAVEVTVAGLVAAPATRRRGALAAAVLFVAVFPGNVQMTVDAFRRNRPAHEKALSVARLPLQAPLIAWALRVRRHA